MISGVVQEIQKSKEGPCGICSKKVMANSLICSKYNFWIHARCAKIPKVSAKLASLNCKSSTNFSARPVESLCDGIETVHSFLYLGSKVDFSGDCETAVTARMRSGWAKFKECRDILLSKSFPLKIKKRLYASCVRSAMPFGSEVWCLRQNELDILQRTEKAMVRAICRMKLSDRFKSKS